MGKTLVIAEKPSVAKILAAHLSAPRCGDRFESRAWIVASCRGHIVDLIPPDAYEGRPWGRPWRLDALPMIPDAFELAPRPACADVFRQLKRLIERDDVDCIVHACDPDREGEAILRRVLAQVGTSKPVKRLWAASLDDAALGKAFAALADDACYDGLADAAWGRACADWLVGMNLSRALTLAHGRAVYAGRVFSPTLRLVAQRTREAASFEPVPYWILEAVLEGGLKLSSERYGDEEAARSDLGRISGRPVEITAMSSSARLVRPPRLYDLTGIQKDAAARCSITAADALEALQGLYEARLVSYPRTDTCFVTSDDLASLEALLSSPAILAIAGKDAASVFSASSAHPEAVVSDKDVMGHTALLPTPELTVERFSALPQRERQLVLLIVARLLAAVSDAQETTVTHLEAAIAGIAFKASVTVENRAGFKAIERAVLPTGPDEGELSDGRELAGLEEGATAAVASLALAARTTKPPRLYTEATLLAAMEHAERLVDDKELARALSSSDTHPAGLGTPATRAETIERLIRRGYVARRKKALFATDEGLAVDGLCPPDLASAELTARWERRLSDIEHGDAPVSGFLDDMAASVSAMVRAAVAGADPARASRRPSPEALGTCPRCGGSIISNRARSVYWCSSRSTHRDAATGGIVVDEAGCGFKLFPTVAGKRLTERQVAALLAGKEISVSGLKRKDGSPFQARLALSATAQAGIALSPRR